MKTLHPNARAIAGIITVLATTAAWRAASGVSPGDPIPDIDVVVEQHPGPRLTTMTDANGAFSFNLAAGTYTLRIGVKSSQVGSAMRPAAAAPGARNGVLVALPDSVTARGGWPYALRLGNGAKGVAKVGLGVARTAQQPAAAARSLELTITMTAAGILRGGVEARN